MIACEGVPSDPEIPSALYHRPSIRGEHSSVVLSYRWTARDTILRRTIYGYFSPCVIRSSCTNIFRDTEVSARIPFQASSSDYDNAIWYPPASSPPSLVQYILMHVQDVSKPTPVSVFHSLISIPRNGIPHGKSPPFSSVSSPSWYLPPAPSPVMKFPPC